MGGRVGCEDVEAAAEDAGREVDGVEELPHGARDLFCGRWGGCGALRSDEAQQVVGVGVVQLQRPGQGVQDLLGGLAAASLLQPQVVVDADAGQQGDLLASQARHPPLAVLRQADVDGSQAPAAGPQEVAQEVVGHRRR